MKNWKFCAILFTLCLFLQSCVCKNETTTTPPPPCTILNKTATCTSNIDFKSLQDTNITKLIVRSKLLKTINHDDLTLFVNLEEIDLSDCDLEEIDGYAFLTLTKLHKLNLSGNKKLKIPADDTFVTSDSITCLNLSNTDIDALGDMLHNIPQLHILDLSGTNVKDFFPVDKLGNLTKLVVSKNNETLANLCNLKLEDIFEKDENGTETLIECKDKPERRGEEPRIKIKIDISIPPELEKNWTGTTLAPTTDAAIEVTTILPTSPEPTESSKIVKEEIQKTPELIHKQENETSTVEAATVPEGPEVPEVAEVPEVPEVPKEEENVIKHVDDEAKFEKPSEDDKKDTGEGKTVKQDEAKTAEEAKTEIVTDEATTVKDLDGRGKTKKDRYEEEEDGRVGKDKDDLKLRIVQEDADDVILPSTETKASSTGVNIVLAIILVVMIVGALGFGYKYWKNRRSGYRHANTQEQEEEKELQTIVSHRTNAE